MAFIGIVIKVCAKPTKESTTKTWKVVLTKERNSQPKELSAVPIFRIDFLYVSDILPTIKVKIIATITDKEKTIPKEV